MNSHDEILIRGNMNSKSSDKKYIKAGIGYTFANYFIKGLSFITLPIYVRLMSTTDYGNFNTYVAYEAMLSVVLGLALHASLKNAKIRYNSKSEFGNYMAACIQMGILSTAVIVVLANMLYPMLADLLDLTRFVFNILLIQSYAAALLTLYNSYVSLEYKYKSYFAVSLINAVSTTGISIFLIITWFSGNRYIGRVIGNAVPAIIIGICIAIYFLCESKNGLKFDGEKWRFGLTFSLPLIFHGVSQVVLNQFDRIMIKSMTGAANAGVYSFAYNIYNLVFVTSASLQNVWGPWFYEKMIERKHDLIRKKGNSFAFGMMLFIAEVLLMSPELVGVLGTEDYASSVFYIAPLVVSGYFAFLYNLPAQIEYYYEKTNYIAGGTCVAAILNIIMNYFGIKQFGSIAAAYTTLIIYLVYFLIHYCLSVKIHGQQVFDLMKLMIYSGELIIIAALSLFLREQIIIRWCAMLILFVFGILWGVKEFKVFSAFKRSTK
ncbi:lipopolysaccharide biosynthesis protein [Blautia sp. MSJ-19]|uniref:lipopolysaccharide biosynthesis protein n=1 Tax=Blautia sp. MSJ-19 TaxID=2841517 RepID=UPI001C0F0C63|nr:oligosaccharide flippase family protein [Blautia sp. MSJ-19]MBU5480146.1 oligosaccharide flippase family protein [Blautia sp. MSJ-19]